MAKRGVLPLDPPKITPEKAIPILEGQIAQSTDIALETRLSSKRQEWVHTSDGVLRMALGAGDRLVGALSSAQCGSYSPYDTEEFLKEQANSQLEGMVSVLKSAVTQLRWQLPDPSQIFLPAGSQHDAYVEIRGILQLGSREVFVIDPFVDGSLWPLLTNVPNSCAIRILTEHTKPDFALEGAKFRSQHGFNIQVRRAVNYHDRFVILDCTRCFHLGTSINHAGNKAFMISEVARPQIASAIVSDAESEWQRAAIVHF
jgi:hypothetical protein